MANAVHVTEALVGQVLTNLDQDGAPARELARLEAEEPILSEWIGERLGLLERLMTAWGAPEPARMEALSACQVHLAGLLIAWRLGRLSRWEKESGILKEGA